MSKLMDHVMSIAEREHIRVLVDSTISGELRNDDDRQISMANVSLRTVVVGYATATQPGIYAAAMHELGHILSANAVALGAGIRQCQRCGNHPDMTDPKNVERIIAMEAAAWQWAREHAMVWTDAMEHYARWALSTYTDSRMEQAA